MKMKRAEFEKALQKINVRDQVRLYYTGKSGYTKVEGMIKKIKEGHIHLGKGFKRSYKRISRIQKLREGKGCRIHVLDERIEPCGSRNIVVIIPLGTQFGHRTINREVPVCPKHWKRIGRNESKLQWNKI